MPRSRTQLILFSMSAAFFALQFLPHHVTRLHDFFSSLYPLFAGYVFVALVLGLFTAVVMWLCARDNDSRLRRRSWCATLAIICCTGIGLSVASVVYARGLPVGSFSSPFDQELWSARSSSQYISADITARQKMLGDVIRTIVVNGNKQDILDKLGPSESDGYFSSSGRDLIYRTGPQRDSLFAIDSEWLLIWFDSTGHTSRYEIRSD